MPQKKSTDILTVQQAADFMGLSRNTLDAWRYRGFGPPHIALGRKIVYRRQAIEAWMEKRTRTSTSSPMAVA